MKRFVWIFPLLVILGMAFGIACQSLNPEQTVNDPTLNNPINGSEDDDADDDSASDDDSGDDDIASGKVIIAYNSDTDNPTAIQNLLAGLNIPADLSPDDEMRNVDLSQYALMIVDTNTYWYNALDVNAVKNSGIPVLGFFYGGGILFDQMALPYGWFYGSTYDTEQYAVPVNPSSAFWTSPYTVTIDGQGRVLVYAATSYLRVNSILGTSDTTEVVAWAVNETDRAAMILMSGKYFYWGFSGVVASMSADGKNLFLNVVVQMLNSQSGS